MNKLLKLSLSMACIIAMTASFMIVQSVNALSEAADDILVLDHGDDTVLTGTILNLNADSMKLRVNDKDIDVDLSDVDKDVDIKDLLSEGQSVTVQGRFDNKELKAKRVVTNVGTAGEAAIKTGIIANDVGDNNHH